MTLQHLIPNNKKNTVHCILSGRKLWPKNGGSDNKASCLQCGRPGFNPWVGEILWRRKWQPTLVLLPGKSRGQRSMVGYSPQGHKESDTTDRLHFTNINMFLHLKDILQSVWLKKKKKKKTSNPYVRHGPAKQKERQALPTMLEGLPWWSSGYESSLQCRGCRFDPWSGN